MKICDKPGLLTPVQSIQYKIRTRHFNLIIDGVFFTLSFDGGGGWVDSIHPLFTCENSSKKKSEKKDDY